jgi:hypothetical protein
MHQEKESLETYLRDLDFRFTYASAVACLHQSAICVNLRLGQWIGDLRLCRDSERAPEDL